MIVDASAIVAILMREPEADTLTDRLEAARSPSTHAVSVFEAVLAIARIRQAPVDEAAREVEVFLADANVTIVSVAEMESAAALQAAARYGKGRHPAALNMGDCFSYACARLRGVPLLYKGEDFARTDLA